MSNALLTPWRRSSSSCGWTRTTACKEYNREQSFLEQQIKEEEEVLQNLKSELEAKDVEIEKRAVGIERLKQVNNSLAGGFKQAATDWRFLCLAIHIGFAFQASLWLRFDEHLLQSASWSPCFETYLYTLENRIQMSLS